MTPYADDIKLPASRKIVFVKAIFLKHFFGWTLSGTAGIWFQPSAELIQEVFENDVATTQTSSFAALVALSVATVGGWFWDEAAQRLYYKSITGSTAFDNFAVAEIVFRWSQFPGEDAEKNVYAAKIDKNNMPSLSLRISPVFESRAGQIGSGTLGIDTTDGLFSRTDFEPDGQIEITETIEGS